MRLWDTRTGGKGALLFLGPSTDAAEPRTDELELGKAMLSGRGRLTSTGEAGALAVAAFKKKQTTNQDADKDFQTTKKPSRQPMAKHSQQNRPLPGVTFCLLHV